MKYVCLLLGPCPNEEEGLCSAPVIDCEFAIKATECATLAIERMQIYAEEEGNSDETDQEGESR